MSDEKTNVVQPAPPESVNEEFLPPSDWDRQNDSDTLILMLPGFRKEQMIVQVTSNRILRLRGKRKISDNKFRQFQKEERLSDYHDTKGITANFEAGMLYVRIPKLKPQPTQQEPPTTATPTQQEPSKPQPTTTTTPTQQQELPPKPQRSTVTTTDHNHKPDAPQQHVDEKDQTNNKKEEKSVEYSKTKTQTVPLPQLEPKAAAEDSSQKKPQKKEMGKADQTEEEKNKSTSKTHQQEEYSQKKEMMSKKAEAEEKSKTSDQTHDQEMHGTTTQTTTFKEQKADHDDSITSKNAEGITSVDGLSKSIVAMMHKILSMISDLVLEVKKQNKVPHFVILIILVLLIGHYVKSAVKSSFEGPKNQEL